MKKSAADIKKIIADKNLNIKFQPVVSVIQKSVIGFEAIFIGASDESGKNIPASELFEIAEKEGIAIELDRLYREKAFEEFQSIYNENKELLIFININISIIDKHIGSGIIMNLASDKGVSSKNVVLQIVEEKIENIDALKEFIYLYRSKGFVIALKNLGEGFVNMDKISYVEPDIIKINKAITKNIEGDYYKQEIFKSIVNLSKKIGALVVCEDIGNEQETMLIMELGADMLEGEYFKNNSEDVAELKAFVDKTAIKYKEYMKEEIEAREVIHKGYDEVINNALNKLSKSSEKQFVDVINEVIEKNNELECAYILDKNGIQVGDTATRCTNMREQRALIFQPAKNGTDHSLKKYYYYLKNMSLERYVTEPYISLATGNLCVTISAVFKNLDKKEYILCIDFNPDYINM
ncbi:EAL domain-containing protein [Clostridium hydrogenum]|uniref:EAL domain-containing protein n=1 Tax=Clostridium hydrogenum TaxID=2855764 RepID=UPI001F2B7BA9|nr:EAL domain-containing protein [Clostridium hydrogenum]